MPFEKVTITEEVQKNGSTQTVERETLKWVDDPAVVAAAQPAMSVLHPDYIPASERVYRWDESLGMSVSEPRGETEVSTEESNAEPEEVTEETATEPAEEEPLPEYKPSRSRK